MPFPFANVRGPSNDEFLCVSGIFLLGALEQLHTKRACTKYQQWLTLQSTCNSQGILLFWVCYYLFMFIINYYLWMLLFIIFVRLLEFASASLREGREPPQAAFSEAQGRSQASSYGASCVTPLLIPPQSLDSPSTWNHRQGIIQYCLAPPPRKTLICYGGKGRKL